MQKTDIEIEEAIIALDTINDWLRWGVTQFELNDIYYGHGTDNARDEMLQLLLWQLKLPFEGYEQFLNCRLTLSEKHSLATHCQKRIESRIPMPYITGESYFCGLKFVVNKSVLIPRSPIAELITQRFSPWLQFEPQQILDLCAGSGCIGIACAHFFDGSEVDLSDISQDALRVAAKNISAFHLNDRVKLIHADLFAGCQKQYDLIVCNPPYVDSKDMASMPKEYEHEPTSALNAGEDGLQLVRQLLHEVEQDLNEEGLLIVEVGNSAEALERAYPQVAFTWVEFVNGGHGVFVMTGMELRQYGAYFKLVG